MYGTDPKHVSKCQGKKKCGKGQTGAKELQQYSCTDALTTMGICNVRA
jgi:hypothetical protein